MDNLDIFIENSSHLKDTYLFDWDIDIHNEPSTDYQKKSCYLDLNNSKRDYRRKNKSPFES